MDKKFKALVVDSHDNQFSLELKNRTVDDLSPGEVIVKVAYSGINYKDGLATTPDGKIVRSYPHIPGIDLAGEVVSSTDQRYKKGDLVIATSYEIGVSHSGGYSEYARIPADWVVPLPEGLTLKEAMIFGTAGFTAALSVQRLQDNGLKQKDGQVLVTGATGGVGSFGVAMLASLGFEVAASTGKESAREYLLNIGATSVISREEVYNGKARALDKQVWSGAIDPVGGESLASILSKINYSGSVAVSGLTGGGSLPTTVFPFILRGINLLGIDSVYCPMEERQKIWGRMATDLKPQDMSQFIDKEVHLKDLPDVLPSILKGEMIGRVIVSVNE